MSGQTISSTLIFHYKIIFLDFLLILEMKILPLTNKISNFNKIKI